MQNKQYLNQTKIFLKAMIRKRTDLGVMQKHSRNDFGGDGEDVE